MIADSGSRKEFTTGAVRDIQEGKGRCDLLPLDVIAEYAHDVVMDDIALFQKTGDTPPLWRVFKLFAKMVGWVLATALIEVSKHFEEGAVKYGDNNWRKGIPTCVYINSAVRHYLKWQRYDVDEPHDRAFLWNILCCIWTADNMPELNVYAGEEKKGPKEGAKR